MNSISNRTFREAITDGLRHEMARDSTVIVLGQDVGRLGGAHALALAEGLSQQIGRTRAAIGDDVDVHDHIVPACAKECKPPSTWLRAVTTLPPRSR